VSDHFFHFHESVGNLNIFLFWAGVEPSPLLLKPFIGLLYQHWMVDGDNCAAVGGMNE
jgi:hypothetical protein